MSLAGMSLLLLTLHSLIADSPNRDPCEDYTVLDQPWRSSKCFETQCSGQWMNDRQLAKGWYRFSSHGNVKIPEASVPFYHCSAWSPGWLNGTHPNREDGEVNRTICFNGVKDNAQKKNCTKKLDIRIKNCTNYFVYELMPTAGFYSVYCTVTDSASNDPCVNHTILDQPWRSTDCSNTESTGGQWMGDRNLTVGWYRFNSSGGWKIPEMQTPRNGCCGKSPGWLRGSHPTVTEGEVMRNVCFTGNGNDATGIDCASPACLDIKVKNCNGYFVYLLKPTPRDQMVYCADSALSDPCVNHTILDQPWRSTDCSSQECSNYMNDENRTEGWYRFKGSAGWKIPETVVLPYKCSGTSPGWLNGHHPSEREGEVKRTVCFSWEQNNCGTKRTIKIKNCGGFFVYWLKPTLCCNKVYCTDPATVPSPLPEETTPEPSDESSSTTDRDTCSDPQTTTSEETSESSTGEPTQQPSSVPAGHTSTDPQSSTSEETSESSTGEPTQQPSSVPAGHTSTEEGQVKSSTRRAIQEEEACPVKGLPTKEECEEMIDKAQLFYIGRSNQEISKEHLRQLLIDQTPCKFVLSKNRS